MHQHNQHGEYTNRGMYKYKHARSVLHSVCPFKFNKYVLEFKIFWYKYDNYHSKELSDCLLNFEKNDTDEFEDNLLLRKIN